MILKKIRHAIVIPFRLLWNNFRAICTIFFKGRSRYLYNELSRFTHIKNNRKSYDELTTTIKETLNDHKSLSDIFSELLKTLNFPDNPNHRREIVPLVKQMMKNNSESIMVKQENDMLLNQLREAESSTEHQIAEFITDLDHNTGLLNILEEISGSDPNNITVSAEELQPILYEVFNRLKTKGLKRIMTAGDIKELTSEKLKCVKIIGENVDIEKDRFMLANKGWKYKDSIISEAILRKR